LQIQRLNNRSLSHSGFDQIETIKQYLSISDNFSTGNLLTLPSLYSSAFCKIKSTMKYAITAGVAIAAAMSGVNTQACAAGSAKEIGGNWYCDAVKAITYSDFGSTGTYNKITTMDGGNCQSEPFDYSGALAPLDGEVR
jgi:Glycine-rich protein domain (DUF2403)